jgi:hypothetical protein
MNSYNKTYGIFQILVFDKDPAILAYTRELNVAADAPGYKPPSSKSLSNTTLR